VRNWPIHTVAEARAYADTNFGASAGAVMELYKFDTDAAVPGALSYAFGDTQFNYGVRGLARGMSKVQPKTSDICSRAAPEVSRRRRRIARRSTTLLRTSGRIVLSRAAHSMRRTTRCRPRWRMPGCGLRQPVTPMGARYRTGQPMTLAAILIWNSATVSGSGKATALRTLISSSAS
jgi:hypothetical protein